jgi:AcrR family transcriptional regulator
MVKSEAATTRRESRGAARRQQVLDAAIACFRQHGFHGASMSAISTAAGMSVGHIYHYFENKDAIIAAIVDRDVQFMAADFDRIGRENNILAAMIEHADIGVERNFDGDAAALSTEILAEAARNPRIREIVQASDRKARQIVFDTLKKAGARVDKGSDIEARIELVAAIFDGLNARAIRNPSLDRKALLAQLRKVMKFLWPLEPPLG